MIKLSAYETVQRARQLADLENSNFISWKENINLLNESYNDLYQKCINVGDKFFIKEMPMTAPISDGETVRYKLPDDFYQLASVNETFTNAPILRKPLNTSDTMAGYDIVNNYLVIYGTHARNVTVKYYPTPKTLLYACDDEVIAQPTDFETATIKDMCNNIFVWVNSDNLQQIEIYADNKQYTYLLDIDFDIENVTLCKNAIVIAGNGNELIYSLAGDNITPQEDFKKVFTGDKELFLLVQSDATIFTLKNINGIPLSKNYDLADFDGVFFLSNNGAMYAVKNGEDYTLYEVYENDTPFFVASFDFPLYYLFFDKENRIYNFNPDNDICICIDTDIAYNYSGLKYINRIDWKNGKGLVTVNPFTKELTEKSIYTDTEIPAPNNLYTQCLAYMLAIAYKAKQNAECVQLRDLYENALHQYFDSLPRDDYGAMRIQNVY